MTLISEVLKEQKNFRPHTTAVVRDESYRGTTLIHCNLEEAASLAIKDHTVNGVDPIAPNLWLSTISQEC